jgi:hypothetical protein
MGLSICRSIIDAYGGRLWGAANELRGVLFRFTLPSANEVINRQAVRETGEPHEDIALDGSHPAAFEGSQ